MNTRASSWLTGLLLTLLTVAAVAAPLDVPRMERAIDLRLSTGQFTGTVLVAQDRRILISKGYGLADIAHRVPNSPQTRFRLGSLTKQFTAACILLLEERGKLKVEDPVRKYVPDAPPAWDRITIFNLLTHTSGIPDFTGFPDYRKTQGQPTTPEQLIARFRDKPLDFPPGSAWRYSNSGYVVLGYIIERVSGLPYARFLHDNIFAPLGMKDSGYDSSKVQIPRHATGYTPGPNGPTLARYIDMSVPFSAGALYSTTGDLLRWQRALYGGRLLKPAELRKMTTPFKNHYAFGLAVEPGPAGGKIFAHNGGIDGFNTHLEYVTADKLSIVVLANLNGPAADDIAADLEKVATGEQVTLISDRVQKALPAAALKRLTGHYATPDGVIITISVKGDHLLSEALGQSLELYPQSSTEAFAKTVDEQFLFEDDAHGQVADAVIQAPRSRITAVKISDAEAARRAAALAARQRAKVGTPGSAAAVRRSLEQLAAGKPDYSQMGATLAQITRAQLGLLQPQLQALGAIQSIQFKAPGPAGSDVYTVAFAKGMVLDVTIVLSPDGKIQGELLRPHSP